MTTYIVTTEIRTPWWLKLLRYFRIKKKRKDFYLTLNDNFFKSGDILATGVLKLKIVGKQKD